MELKKYLKLKDKADGELHRHIIIAHRNCPDGAATVVLAKKVFPDIFYIMASHERMHHEALQAAEVLEPGGILIIADIVPPQETFSKLFDILAAKKASCRVYDHHQSTQWLENMTLPTHLKGEIIFNIEKCATKIFFDHYLPTHPSLAPYEKFVLYTNDRDLWIRNHAASDELAYFHRLLGDVGYIKRFLKNPIPEFVDDGKMILNAAKHHQYLREERLLKNIKIHSDKDNYKYGLLYGESESSDLLNKALERYKLEYAFLVNLHTKRVSMRGRGNLDCAHYAEQYGGGGHKKASGFSIPVKEPLL
ncbi:hypothetical protein COTS27_00208 [Spirochaetota bacterium]|nr:hypothetical protein COTS27_00208 [Spirochaetota bacterium]